MTPEQGTLFDLPREDVKEVGDGVFLVQSGTTASTWYRVDAGRCECLGFVHRGSCKHVKMLRKEGLLKDDMTASEIMGIWRNVRLDEVSGYEVLTGRYHVSSLASPNVVPVRTSMGKPKFKLGYALEESMSSVMPDGWMLKLDPKPFVDAYMAKLERVGINAIMDEINAISKRHGGATPVLLCYENIEDGVSYCHRRIASTWIEKKVGIVVPEFVD